MEELPTTPLSPASDPVRHYDRVAVAWGHLLGEDLHYGLFTPDTQSLGQATDNLTAAMLTLAAPTAGDQVLDVGCGTGHAGCHLAAQFQCSVTGISPSQVCVRESLARAHREGVSDRAFFLPADAMQLPFADGVFSCAWVMESSHLMPDKQQMLAECARVLSADGRLVLCDIMLGRALALEEVLEYRDEFLLLRDVFGRAKMETMGFYEGHLQALGLEILHRETLVEQIAPTFEHWRRNALSAPLEVREGLGEQACEQFLAACEVLEMFWREGVLHYGLIAAARAG
jgi:27-O-demethylrifamycin SV methyltransferase